MSVTRVQLIGNVSGGASFTGIVTTSSVVVSAGTTALPSISPTSDSNTGVFFPAADTIAVSTGGTERVRIDSSGRLGIGTAIPGGILHTLATGFDNVNFFERTSGSKFGIYNSGTDSYVGTFSNTPFRLATNDIERARIRSDGMFEVKGAGTAGSSPAFSVNGSAPANSAVIDSSGRFGIGTSSPNTALDVNGTINVRTNSFEFGRITTNNVSANVGGLNFQYNNAGTFTNGMVLNGGGSVGIGTISPGAPLDVIGIIATSDGIYTRTTAQTLTICGNPTLINSVPRIELNGTANANPNQTSIRADTTIFTRNNASLESARIDSSGRLLVGTSSARSNFFNTTVFTPQIQLEGTGNPEILSIISSDTTYGPYLLLARQKSGSVGGNTAVSNNDLLGVVDFQGSDGTEFIGAGQIKCEVDGTPGANDMPGRLVFSTTADGAASPAERMRISSEGVVTITVGGASPIVFGGTNATSIFRSGANGSGVHFTTNAVAPSNEVGALSDNTESLGTGAWRWSVVFAGTGTINTSDLTEKQDVENFNLTEINVASAIKSLIKKYRFKDAVIEKGSDARVHVGVIAQEVEQAFVAEGLDPRHYGMFCEDELEDGRKRLGIRYDELLAFVIAGL